MDSNFWVCLSDLESQAEMDPVPAAYVVQVVSLVVQAFVQVARVVAPVQR